jgi:hypothetical protein
VFFSFGEDERQRKATKKKEGLVGHMKGKNKLHIT